jgi:hypothetical protein
MKEIKPVYKILLLIAIITYVVGVSFLLADLQNRVGELEHALTHVRMENCQHHDK